MANRRATFYQSDLSKVLKAFKDVCLPTPQIVIEHGRITVSPLAEPIGKSDPNEWDEK